MLVTRHFVSSLEHLELLRSLAMKSAQTLVVLIRLIQTTAVII